MKRAMCFVALVALVLMPAAVAQVYVDANLATGAGDGTSWADAFQGAGGLQAGINAAAGGEVWVAEGTYSGPNVLSTGTVLLGGFSNGDALADRDPATKVTVIDGGGTERGLVGVGVQNTVVDGFTLQNGFTAENGGGFVGINMDNTNAVRNLIILNCDAASGGGISFTNSQAIVEDCVVDGCASTGDGGNGRFESCTGMTVTRCTFSNGTGGGQSGGVIAGWGNTTFVDCDFTDNSTANGGGGMFYIAGNAVVDGCTFEGNSAGWLGGGLAFWDSGTWTVTDCEFIGNTCDLGGGLSAFTSTVSITGSVFTGNSGWNGSAAALWDFQGATVSDCEFIGNLATEVLKIVNIAAGQTALVTNCLFTENDTPGCSGVRHHSDPSRGTVNVVNCTLAGNLGGGAPILTSGSAVTNVLNTIAWGNNPDGGRYDYDEEGAGPVTTVNHSLFEEFPPIGHLDPNPFLDGTGNLTDNPLFADATAGDFRLLPGSPALDSGDDADPLVPATDLLGDPRPGTVAGVSMGAYEEAVPTESVPDVLSGGDRATLEDVETLLQAAGFTVGTITSVYDNTVPVGLVIGQDPPPGSLLPAGSAVNLFVSRGPEMVASSIPVASPTVLLALVAIALLGGVVMLRRRVSA